MTHPSTDILAAYAEGRSDRTLRCLVELHLRACPGCARFVGERGEPVAEESGEILSDGEREVLRSAWGRLERTLRTEREKTGKPADLPAEIFQATGGVVPAGGWHWHKPWFRKSRIALVMRDPYQGHSLLCVHLGPGGSLQRHRHASSEQCVVVRGGFSDEDGSYGPGDWCEALPGTSHRPVAKDGEECWALVRREGRSGGGPARGFSADPLPLGNAWKGLGYRILNLWNRPDPG